MSGGLGPGGHPVKKVHPTFDLVDELGGEAAAFRRAICADPADDAPRLVFADWLDEGGYGVEATVTRNQVRRPDVRMDIEDILPGRGRTARSCSTWASTTPSSPSITTRRSARSCS